MNMFLKPGLTAEGKPLRVPYPHDVGRYLPSEGAFVEFNFYWQRRLNDGDVVEATPPEEPVAPAQDQEAQEPVAQEPEPKSTAKTRRSRERTDEEAV